jgi:hypothetical protein
MATKQYGERQSGLRGLSRWKRLCSMVVTSRCVDAAHEDPVSVEPGAGDSPAGVLVPDWSSQR